MQNCLILTSLYATLLIIMLFVLSSYLPLLDETNVNIEVSQLYHLYIKHMALRRLWLAVDIR